MMIATIPLLCRVEDDELGVEYLEAEDVEDPLKLLLHGGLAPWLDGGLVVLQYGQWELALARWRACCAPVWTVGSIGLG
uniref:Abhydro_lipase domain-containing protein n=1 Tax=Meloidogyne hapla TaxID=6305 RepID=A0A1I8AWD5_MELHA